MIAAITNFIESKDRPCTRPPEARLRPSVLRQPEADRNEARTGFTKVFRWPVPAEQTPQPTAVEVVGTFTDWQKVPLAYDKPTRTWVATLNSIPSNHTHRYVMLVDGTPTYDKTCDGLTAPQSSPEAKWQIATPRGPRVMLLFGQTK